MHYEKNRMKKKLMQSYGEFQPIPRKCAKSSSTCVDKQTFFSQIGETGKIVVQRRKYYLILSSSETALYAHFFCFVQERII